MNSEGARRRVFELFVSLFRKDEVRWETTNKMFVVFEKGRREGKQLCELYRNSSLWREGTLE